MWDRIRVLARSFDIDLVALLRKKSASEKLILAAAMQDTTSVSLSGLAQRLQMGATGMQRLLLIRFRARKGQAAAENSGFQT